MTTAPTSSQEAHRGGFAAGGDQQGLGARAAWPDKFKGEEAQEKERQRLFRIIEQLVLWRIRRTRAC